MPNGGLLHRGVEIGRGGRRKTERERERDRDKAVVSLFGVTVPSEVT